MRKICLIFVVFLSFFVVKSINAKTVYKCSNQPLSDDVLNYIDRIVSYKVYREMYNYSENGDSYNLNVVNKTQFYIACSTPYYMNEVGTDSKPNVAYVCITDTLGFSTNIHSEYGCTYVGGIFTTYDDTSKKYSYNYLLFSYSIQGKLSVTANDVLSRVDGLPYAFSINRNFENVFYTEHESTTGETSQVDLSTLYPYFLLIALCVLLVFIAIMFKRRRYL